MSFRTNRQKWDVFGQFLGYRLCTMCQLYCIPIPFICLFHLLLWELLFSHGLWCGLSPNLSPHANLQSSVFPIQGFTLGSHTNWLHVCLCDHHLGQHRGPCRRHVPAGFYIGSRASPEAVLPQCCGNRVCSYSQCTQTRSIHHCGLPCRGRHFRGAQHGRSCESGRQYQRYHLQCAFSGGCRLGRW